jgi:hypothetical protein
LLDVKIVKAMKGMKFGIHRIFMPFILFMPAA